MHLLIGANFVALKCSIVALVLEFKIIFNFIAFSRFTLLGFIEEAFILIVTIGANFVAFKCSIVALVLEFKIIFNFIAVSKMSGSSRNARNKSRN